MQRNMRTLATQMRLRRALRVAADYELRLSVERSRSLAAAASVRLQQLCRDVRSSWLRESQAAQLGSLRTFVNRSLTAMEAAAAAMARPGTDLSGLTAEFREAGLPLVFCLRGLDDLSVAAFDELTGAPLPRSA